MRCAPGCRDWLMTLATDDEKPVLTTGDAFGEVLRECWRKGGGPGAAFEIVERDDGFLSVVDGAHYFAPLETLSPPDLWACERVTGRVLDVGCGAGRHAVHLMAKKYDVTGVDPSPGAVDVASSRGVPVIQGTIDDLTASGTFDTALLMGNNLGLLEGGERGRQVLDKLAALVRPGGRLIGSGVDPSTESDPEHLAYQARNRARGRMPGQLRVRVRYRCLSTQWFDYLHASPEELRTLTAGTAWTISDAIVGPFRYAVMLTRQSDPG
jgi:SAM-dependent methyltransferase